MRTISIAYSVLQTKTTSSIVTDTRRRTLLFVQLSSLDQAIVCRLCTIVENVLNLLYDQSQERRKVQLQPL